MGQLEGWDRPSGGFSDMSVNKFYYDHQEYKWFMDGILTSFTVISKSHKTGGGVDNDPVALI